MHSGMTESPFIQLEWASECAGSKSPERENDAFISLMSGREQTRGRRRRSSILDYWQLLNFYPLFLLLLLSTIPYSFPSPSLLPLLTAASYKVEENCMAHIEWWQIDCAVVMARVMGRMANDRPWLGMWESFFTAKSLPFFLFSFFPLFYVTDVVCLSCRKQAFLKSFLFKAKKNRVFNLEIFVCSWLRHLNVALQYFFKITQL